MTNRYDERGRPVGLDWNVINAGCPQDPSVWKKAATETAKSPAKLGDETEAAIVRMHHEGLRAAEIAESLDIATATVGKVLDRRGVTEDRGRGTRQKTPDDVVAEVIRLYTEEQLGGVTIHRRTGLSPATIYKILRRNGVPTRSSKAA